MSETFKYLSIGDTNEISGELSHVKITSAYHCMENPVIPGRIQMGWFIPVEIYQKK